ncbi:MAG: aminodeoxychorismate lyase [Gammaproteobacteria bacterium]|nr:aminodeoxychorismate lyase [Gammaproteobacteria bacterium]|tara:strand:- start:73799 stop:74629 length:831 start_codon:yes stop_codon:yes gene_type:complete
MLVNGLPQKTINLDDRGLAYGDGVFETVRLVGSRPVFLSEHLQRLRKGCEKLGLNCDFAKLENEISSLQARFTDYAILKILISRGAGGRGYRPASEMSATRILTLHPLPELPQLQAGEGVRVFVCEYRLSQQAELAGIKHLNRLDQVMASREWPEPGMFEGLMRDQQGYIIEGTRSNLFYAQDGSLYTPALKNCGVAGIFRDLLLQSGEFDISVIENVSLQALLQADELFLCNSVTGVWPVSSLENAGKTHHYATGSFATEAMSLFGKALHADNAD